MAGKETNHDGALVMEILLQIGVSCWSFEIFALSDRLAAALVELRNSDSDDEREK